MRLASGAAWLTISLASVGVVAQPSQTQPSQTQPSQTPPSGEETGGSAGVPTEEPGPQTRAEALFNQGLEEMLQGRYDTGCPALAESYRLDPLAGALFTLAECEAKWGKLSEALNHYRQYLARYDRMAPDQRIRQRGRDKVAKEQVAELAGRVPTLTIVLDPRIASGVVVERDGQRVASSLYERPIEVDPGEHTLRITEPEMPPRELKLRLAEGEKRRFVVKPQGRPQTRDDRKDKGRSDGDDDQPVLSRQSMLIGAYASGAVGAAGLIVGSIAGAVTLGHKSTIDDNCVESICNQQGLDAASAARVSGAVSTVGFVIGIAGAAAAVTLWLLAPPESEPNDSSRRRLTDWLSGRVRW